MRLLAFVTLGMILGVTDATADLVYLTSGRTVSVRSVQEDGESVVLTLRGGGQIVCSRALVAQVVPDEVPYPEPDMDPLAGPAPAAGVQRAAGAAGLLPDGPVPFGELISRASSAHGVDSRLVRAVIHVESAYQSRARSPKGAMGLMQLMPATARRYALRRPFDPAANIDAGTRHLRWLLDRFPLDLALAAYNAGEATVTRYRGMPPYQETREYVSRILQLIGAPADKR